MERLTGGERHEDGDGWTNTTKREEGGERERRKDGRIKDLHSKANTTRERDDSAEETESLRRAERGSAQVVLTSCKKEKKKKKKKKRKNSCVLNPVAVRVKVLRTANPHQRRGFGADADGTWRSATEYLLRVLKKR